MRMISLSSPSSSSEDDDDVPLDYSTTTMTILKQGGGRGGVGIGKPELGYGVQLKHLSEIPVDPNSKFYTACDYIKDQTKDMDDSMYKSYANFLLQNDSTKHLVKAQADAFISYAWGGAFGSTMEAVKEQFKDELETTFIWMDFVIVDQHAASTSNVNFDEWCQVFKSNLLKTKRAVLVLTPGHEPLALSRSWCCFEWVTVLDSNIQFDICVPPIDFDDFVKRVTTEVVGTSVFSMIWKNINVERAKANKQSDQDAILLKMKEIGLVKVNDIVMNSTKKWLENVLEVARMRVTKGTREEILVMNSSGSLYHELVSWGSCCDFQFPLFLFTIAFT